MDEFHVWSCLAKEAWSLPFCKICKSAKPSSSLVLDPEACWLRTVHYGYFMIKLQLVLPLVGKKALNFACNTQCLGSEPEQTSLWVYVNWQKYNYGAACASATPPCLIIRWGVTVTLSSSADQVCLRIHLPELNLGTKPRDEDGGWYYFLSSAYIFELDEKQHRRDLMPQALEQYQLSQHQPAGM